MEHWKWIAGGMLILLLGMRFAKGCWVKALMSAFIAPLLLVPIFYSALFGITCITEFFWQLAANGNAPRQTIADFGLAGSIAVTIALFIFYCMWERQMIGIEARGTLGGSVKNQNFTSPHALKRKIV